MLSNTVGILILGYTNSACGMIGWGADCTISEEDLIETVLPMRVYLSNQINHEISHTNAKLIVILSSPTTYDEAQALYLYIFQVSYN
jgi:hypothetical protein